MGSTTVQAAQQPNYAQQTSDTLASQIALAPQQYAAEAQYQPLYNQLQLQLANQSLNGVTDANGNYNPGLLSMYSQLTPQLGNISAAANTQQRSADIADVNNLGPQATQALLNANPLLNTSLQRANSLNAPINNAQTNLLNSQITNGSVTNALNQQAQNLLSTNGALSPEEQRQADQQTRAAYAARGLAMGPQAIGAEVQNRLINQYNRNQQNISTASGINQNYINNLGQAAQLNNAQMGMDRGYATQMVGVNQAALGDPFQTILGRPSSAYNSMQSAYNQGQSNTASAGPSLFNPESSYASNIYTSNTQAQNAANAATAANNASMIGGALGGLAKLGAAPVTGGGSLAGSLFCWVAREIYGEDNPKWMIFRNWMLNYGPVWFKNLYLKHGERFAAFISNKPLLKKIIRKWMDSKIEVVQRSENLAHA
jgi:hypothetical protein